MIMSSPLALTSCLPSVLRRLKVNLCDYIGIVVLRLKATDSTSKTLN